MPLEIRLKLLGIYNFLMIDTLQIYEELKDEITPSAARKIAEVMGGCIVNF